MRLPSILSKDEWLKWRTAGIGSSDAPTVCGYSPFDNAVRLLCEKSGLVPKKPLTPYLSRGLKWEPIARELYNRKHGVNLEPANFIHDENPWLRASIDGIDADNKMMIEIKCPGYSSFRHCVEYGPPLNYVIQMHHAWQVSGVERIVFVAMYAGELFEQDVVGSKLWLVVRQNESKIFERKQRFYREMVVLRDERARLTDIVKQLLSDASCGQSGGR